MANTATQFGFRHIGFLSGGAPDYQLSTAAILSTYTTKIFFGDPVIFSTASQYIQPAISSVSVTAIIGGFQGCEFVPSAGGAPVWSPYWPGAQGGDGTAYLINAKNAKFLAAALLTAIPTTWIGRNVGFSTGAGGATTGGGFSSYVVDFATLTTTYSQGAFTLIGMYPGVGNGSDTTTSFNWVVVGFNNLCTALIA